MTFHSKPAKFVLIFLLQIYDIWAKHRVSCHQNSQKYIKHALVNANRLKHIAIQSLNHS